MNMQLVILVVVLILAIAVVAWSIRWHIAEVHEDEAAWDALIERVRGGES